jgi:hypothetical protein
MTSPNLGAQWLEIIQRPTLEAFARAFASDARLEASVLEDVLIGPADIRAFFDATRAMYDQIAFTRETLAGDRTILEREGIYNGRRVAGVTIQARDASGAIASIQLYHQPLSQVNAFAADLVQRLAFATRRDPA